MNDKGCEIINIEKGINTVKRKSGVILFLSVLAISYLLNDLSINFQNNFRSYGELFSCVVLINLSVKTLN